MKVVTSSQMNEIDRLATDEYGIPGILLMENAGLQVVEAALSLLTETEGPVAIVCGPGNNGGDGLVAARHLSNSGYPVACFLLGEPEKLKGDTLTNYIILKRIGREPVSITTEAELEGAVEVILHSRLIIDALYGTGFRGELAGLQRGAVELINQSSAQVLAVDIPSGLDADRGMVADLAVEADWTVTMALPKLGLLQPEAAAYVGRLTVADISMPLPLIESSHLKANLITESAVRQYLPLRPRDSHKGDYGHVLVAGGCPDMTGAVVMAAQAAARTGAGLVTAALPAPARQSAAVQMPQIMTMALPATGQGNLAPEAGANLLAALEKMTVGVLGPGMGRYAGGEDLVAQVIRRTPVPLIVDADALNLLAAQPEVLKEAGAPLILTPHPGEMSRLTGMPVREIAGNRMEIACNFAARWGVILILKGSRTLVATPEGQVFINTTGNPGMACGGSGDVLAGMVAGLVAQGLPVDAAAASAVYLHGKAGDLAAQIYGERSMTAPDIIQALPEVFKEVQV